MDTEICTEEKHTDKRQRGWPSTSQGGKLATEPSCTALGKNWCCPHLGFGLLASTAVRKQFSVFKPPSTLLWQT